MNTWLTLTEAAQRIQGDAALASAERRIRRWVESGDLKPLAGRFSAADVLAAERRMRARRGRPRKAQQDQSRTRAAHAID